MSTIPRRDALALVAGGLATTVTFIRQVCGQVLPPGHSNNLPAFAVGVVNVREHGATGDGITDDTAAITAALATAASGGRAIAPVIFPLGTYLVPNGITTSTKGLTVIGLGHRNMRAAGAPLTGTILKTTAAGKWTWVHDTGDQDYEGYHFEGITFGGTRDTAGGLHIKDSANGSIQRCTFDGHIASTAVGCWINYTPGSRKDSSWVHIDNCMGSNCMTQLRLGRADAVDGFAGATVQEFVNIKTTAGGIRQQ